MIPNWETDVKIHWPRKNYSKVTRSTSATPKSDYCCVFMIRWCSWTYRNIHWQNSLLGGNCLFFEAKTSSSQKLDILQLEYRCFSENWRESTRLWWLINQSWWDLSPAHVLGTCHIRVMRSHECMWECVRMDWIGQVILMSFYEKRLQSLDCRVNRISHYVKEQEFLVLISNICCTW